MVELYGKRYTRKELMRRFGDLDFRTFRPLFQSASAFRSSMLIMVISSTMSSRVL